MKIKPKIKLTFNEQFNQLVAFISRSEEIVTYKQLFEFAIENGFYVDLYKHFPLLDRLIIEHNSQSQISSKSYN